MADVTQQEAEELADALINAAGALVMNASQMNQSRCADARHRVVEALTRPAPSPSDVEAAWRDLLEKDDRTSPAEYPDMALITFDEFAAVARMRGAAVPDELMSALATLFHGYCRLEDGDQKFAMVVPPDWTWQGRHPSDCVKAWAVVCDTVYPAAPEVPR